MRRSGTWYDCYIYEYGTCGGVSRRGLALQRSPALQPCRCMRSVAGMNEAAWLAWELEAGFCARWARQWSGQH